MEKARLPVHPGASSPPQPNGAVVPHQAKPLQRWAARLAFIVERLLTSSLRYTWHDATGMFDSATAEPVIFCLWHNRLALSMAMYRKWPQRLQPQRRLAAMVSASKDGALLAKILENFGVQPVRGSTSRRGPQALLELTSWAERGYDLAITPDGPRGPRYVVQEGVVALAQLTGLPVLPVTYHTRWKICAKSWDAFQIPLPFGHCKVVFHKPLALNRNASQAERESFRKEIEQRLCS